MGRVKSPAELWTPSQKKQTALTFVRIFLAGATILAATYLAFAWSLAHRAESEFKVREQTRIHGVAVALDGALLPAINDLGFIAALPVTRDAIESPSHQTRSTLAEVLLAFTSNQNSYDHVRWIDASGQETIRVNRIGNESELVPNERLQSKAHRNYFEKTMTLAPGEIYISPFDINEEQGQAEHPPRPTIRVCTPMDDSRGVRRGILCLNITSASLLSPIRIALNGGQHPLLLTDRSGVVAPLNSETRPPITDTDPAVWSRISSGTRGAFRDGESWWIFERTRPAGASANDQPNMRGGRLSLSDVAAAGTEWCVISKIGKGDTRFPAGIWSLQTLGGVAALVGLWGSAAAWLAFSQTAKQTSNRQNALLALVAEKTINGVVFAGRDGRVTWVNEGFTRMSGYDLAFMRGKDPGTILQGPFTNPAAEKLLSDAIASRSFCELDILNYDKSGRSYWANVQLSPIDDANVGLVGFMMLQTDITQKKRSEESLRTEAERTSLALTSLEAGVFERNVSNDQLIWDDQMHAIYGIEKSSERTMTYSDWLEAVVPEDRNAQIKTLTQTLEKGGTSQREFRIRRSSDGEIRVLLASEIVIRDEQTQNLRLIGINRDVTESRRVKQALRAAQLQLDVAFENSPIGKAIISPEGNILRVNRAFVGLFDYEKNALLSMTLDGLTHPDDWQNAFDLNQRVLVGDIPGFQMEIRYIHAEGHTIWAQLNSTLVRDPDGLPEYLISQIQDITVRRKTEQALIKSQRLLEETGRLAKVGGWEYHIESQEVTWSDEVRRIHDVPLDYLPTLQTSLGFYPPSQRAMVSGKLEQAFKSNAPVEFECEIVTATGRSKWVRCHGHYLPEERRVVGTFCDISTEHDAKLLRLESETRFRAIADAAPVLVWVSQDTHSGSWVNQTWLNFTGQTQEQASGPNWVDALHPEDRERARKHFEQARLKHEAFEVEFRMRRHDGEYRWMMDRGVPRIGPQGELLGIVGACADIHAYLESQIQLLQINADLEKSRSEAERASRVKGDFLAGMSHEIRTPLNGIVGIAELLADTNLNERQSEFVTILKSSSESLLALITDILDFSRMEAGMLNITTSTFDLPALLDEICTLLTLQAKDRHIAFRFSCDQHLPRELVCDPVRLRQILLNLLSNAIKFTSIGEVHLVASIPLHSPTHLQFHVLDTGRGIPENQQPMIFQPFHQAESTLNKSHSGSGLGLAISKNIVEELGGRIGFSSVPGKGSDFWFTIPLNVPEEPQPSVVIPTPVSHADEKDVLRRAAFTRLLLAEDNRINQKLAVRMLEKIGFLEITLASNGAEAIARFQDDKFDVILMDVQMPEVDGLQATRHIRALEAASGSSHIPIIALTAHVTEAYQEECRLAGMDGFLSKPIATTAMRDCLSPFLRAQTQR